MSLVEDGMARGLLPAFSIEQACTVDLRELPPALAEVRFRARVWRNLAPAAPPTAH